jgi:hypothetical protein
MFGIPEWAFGVGTLIVASFAGIALMIRLLPPEMRVSRKQRLTQTEHEMLEDLRRRVGEVEERVDFAERLLARPRPQS